MLLNSMPLFFNFSEFTTEGKKLKQLESILLNGGNIAMIVPGGEPKD
jgi:hypothetical protein